MAENLPSVAVGSSFRFRRVMSIFLLTGLVAGLIAYKAQGGLKRIGELRSTGTVHLHPEKLHRPAGAEFVATATQTLRYVKIVWPALLLGVLIGAAVNVTITPRSLAALFGHGEIKPQLAAAAAGAPLMLCSCCVSPIFPTVYRQSRRLRPSLAFMLAAPSLNPATLALSFLIFPLQIAGARLIIVVVLVLMLSALVERAAGPIPVPAAAVDDFAAETEDGVGAAMWAYLRSLAQITVRTVPWILLGIGASMMIANRVPIETFAFGGSKVLIVTVVATVGLLLTMPTFFEIPLALSLLAAGASAGAALAILVAGPAINLASLLVIARASHWRVAALVAAAVWASAVAGGLLIG